MNSLNYSLSNCIPFLLQRPYNNIIREIHIEHISNLNTKSCSLFHLGSFCCTPFSKPSLNRTSSANNVVVNCKLLSNIISSKIIVKPISDNTLIGLEVNGWRWHCRSGLQRSKFEVSKGPDRKNRCVVKPLLAHRSTSRSRNRTSRDQDRGIEDAPRP
jgi:hypothetical protein